MQKLIITFLISNILLLADNITSSQASNFIGKSKTVCGKVASTYYAKNSNGSPTFLNIDKPYPNQEFTVVIFDEYRMNFTIAPEEYYKNKNICVNGKIDYYNYSAQIKVKKPSQIRIK